MIYLVNREHKIVTGLTTEQNLITNPMKLVKNRLSVGDILYCQVGVKINWPADVGSQNIVIAGYYDNIQVLLTVPIKPTTAVSDGFVTAGFGLAIGNDGKLYASSFENNARGNAAGNNNLYQDVLTNTGYITDVSGVGAAPTMLFLAPAIDSGNIQANGVGSIATDLKVDHSVNFTIAFNENQPAAVCETIFASIRWFRADNNA